jgi:hypothetical protein
VYCSDLHYSSLTHAYRQDVTACLSNRSCSESRNPSYYLPEPLLACRVPNGLRGSIYPAIHPARQLEQQGLEHAQCPQRVEPAQSWSHAQQDARIAARRHARSPTSLHLVPSTVTCLTLKSTPAVSFITITSVCHTRHGILASCATAHHLDSP